MKAIGLDIGTTTICAVVVDGGTGSILDTITENNEPFLTSGFNWEKLQDPLVIYNKVNEIVEKLCGKHAPTGCIGVTGQMHGIVYTDSYGNAVSPLYNWQDGRGDLGYDDNMSYAEFLSCKTKYKLATGYGTVTHFYNMHNGLVPSSARFICTINDYIAMKLSRCTVPQMNATNAASLGLFDMETCRFDNSAILCAEMDSTLFPPVSQGTRQIGTTGSNIPVVAAIGDNQASFIGTVRDMDECILINVGTGSQVSLFAERQIHSSCVETRPFPDNGFLLVGAPLCGGSAYALLDKFFRSVVYMATGKEISHLYDVMEKYAEELLNAEDKMEVSTMFRGTRDNPSLRGGIGNIGMDNFTPQHFVLGFLEGIVKELHDLYDNMLPVVENKPVRIVGSGNGIRKNPLLQRIISRKFNMKLHIPVNKEEAAFGAALFAMAGVGYFKDISEAQTLICYKEGEL
jgi:sedoheptulokinase